MNILKKVFFTTAQRVSFKNNSDSSKAGNFCLSDKKFTKMQMVKSNRELTKAGRLCLFAYMDGKPVKIYECNNQKHAQYIQNISSYFSVYFPVVYLKVDKYIVAEWVDGEELSGKLADFDLMGKIAKLQADLHACTHFEKEDVGFDYIEFLIERLNKYKGILKLSDEFTYLKQIADDLICAPRPAVSHPDLSLQNLIRNKKSAIKIVDNELLANNSYYHIDIFNTLNSISNRKDSHKYLVYYKKNGGDLNQIIKNSRFYSNIWKLRLLGSVAQSGNYEKLVKLSKMDSEKIAEPMLSCIDKCK